MGQNRTRRRAVLSIKHELELGIQAANTRGDDENQGEWLLRLRPQFINQTPLVCGFSGTPWMKNFLDMAAMIAMIQQPWREHDNELKEMTGARCRAIGTATRNMAARTTQPSVADRVENIDQMSKVLNKLMIKRTATSKVMNTDKVLVALPPRETRMITCPLDPQQRSIIRDADSIIIKQAREDHEKRSKEARRLGKEPPKPTAMSYISKTHKLRAATVVSNILAFAEQHNLKLTDEELRDGRDLHGPGLKFILDTMWSPCRRFHRRLRPSQMEV